MTNPTQPKESGKFGRDFVYPLVTLDITKNLSPLLMGKLTISMAIFRSYVSLPEGISH